MFISFKSFFHLWLRKFHTITTLIYIFGDNYYLELHNAISYYRLCNINQVKLLLFYNVQTTNLTFGGKI